MRVVGVKSAGYRLLLVVVMNVLSGALQAQHVRLSFHGETLPVALRELARISPDYSINFIYNDLEDFIVTTDIVDATVPQAIKQMIGHYPISVTEGEGKTIYLECYGKGLPRYRGTVMASEGLPLSEVNVAILNPADSSVIGSGVSGEAGVFVIPSRCEKVLLRFSHVSFNTLYIHSESYDVGHVVMHRKPGKVMDVLTVDSDSLHTYPLMKGVAELRNYLEQNVGYPRDIKKRKRMRVNVSFYLNRDSTITFRRILYPRKPSMELIARVMSIFERIHRWVPKGNLLRGNEEKVELNMTFYLDPNFHYKAGIKEVKVTKPGMLDQVLTQAEKYTCISLKVYGPLNSADIVTLRAMSGGEGRRGTLRLLDLSNARIVSDSKPYLAIDAELHRVKVSLDPLVDCRVILNDRFIYLNAVNEQGMDWYGPRWIDFSQEMESRDLRKMKVMGMRKIRGHRIERHGGLYYYVAHCCRDVFCEDMFYQCPDLRVVIVPWSAKVSKKINVRDSDVKYMR